jgi:hypothetical protein
MVKKKYSKINTNMSLREVSRAVEPLLWKKTLDSAYPPYVHLLPGQCPCKGTAA